MEHSARRPIATWNPARDVWEVQTTGLFCEHSDVFSETFPSSGMTRGGRLFVLPTWEQLMDGSACSSSPGLRMLPTPNASLVGPHGERGARTLESRKGKQVELPDVIAALPVSRSTSPDRPTPRTSDTNGAGAHGEGGPDLRTAVELLPTPRTKNNENRQSEGYRGKDGNYYGLLTGQSSWGDYAPAIARWEHVIGRPAPAPTEPGKNGNPRLSPLFVEWLMGLPAGHVTDPAIGLTRNEQLKALGNGVVPQQAAAAAQAFLADFAALEVTA